MASAAPASANAIPVTSHVDDNDNSTCSLREAIRTANDDVPFPGCDSGDGEDVVLLGPGTYTLSSMGRNDDSGLTGDLDVNGSDALIIQGHSAGTAIDANGIDRAIDNYFSAPLAINDIRIVNGNPGITETGSAAYGGAIRSNGELTLQRVTLENNRTADGPASTGQAGGGGAGLFAMGLVTIRNSVFRFNTTGAGATPAPGYVGGGNGGVGGALLVSGGPIGQPSGGAIEDSIFVGNRTGPGGDDPDGFGGAGGSGSAIFDSTRLEIANTLISGNTVGDDGVGSSRSLVQGGALLSASAVVTLRYVTVADNVAEAAGTPNGLDNRVMNGGGSFDLAASILVGDGLVCSPNIAAGGDVFTSAGSGCPGIGDGVLLDGAHIPAAGSPPVDTATAECPATDIRGKDRPVGSACDAGAIERGPASLQLSANALAFPSTVVSGVSDAQGVDVTYSGEGFVVLGALSTQGDYSAHGCAQQTLVSGEPCAITVRFAPHGGGARPGAFSLASPLGTQTVALSGTGIIAGGGIESRVAGGGGRAAIVSASIRRRRGKVRVSVKLACSGRESCTGTLKVSAKRKGHKALRASRAISLAAGQTRVRAVVLGKARALPKRTKMVLRVRLVSDSHSITRTFKTRVH